MPVIRKFSRPATGTVQWQHPCPETGNPVLRITVTRSNGQRVSNDYEVEKVEGGFDLHYLNARYQIVTYHLRSRTLGEWYCDCPDACGCNHCKHARGLRAVLAREPF